MRTKNLIITIIYSLICLFILVGCSYSKTAEDENIVSLNKKPTMSPSIIPQGASRQENIEKNENANKSKYSAKKGKGVISINEAALSDEWESVEEVNQAYADYLVNVLQQEYGVVEDFSIRRTLLPSPDENVLYKLGNFHGEEGILYADIRDLDVNIDDWAKDNELIVIDRVRENTKWIIELQVFKYEDGEIVRKCKGTLDEISLNDEAYWFRLKIFYKEIDGFKRICSCCTYNSFDTRYRAGNMETHCFQYNDGKLTQEDYAQGEPIGTILNMWGNSQNIGFKIDGENAGEYFLFGRTELVMSSVWNKDKYGIERDDRSGVVRNEQKDVGVNCVYYYENAYLDKSIKNADKINSKIEKHKEDFFKDEESDPGNGVEAGHLLTKYNTADIQSVYLDDKYFSFSQKRWEYTVNHAMPYTYEAHTFDLETGEELTFEEILGIDKDEAGRITRQLIADYMSNKKNIHEGSISELPDIEGYLQVYESRANSEGYKYYIDADGDICLLLNENINYYLENAGATAVVYVDWGLKDIHSTIMLDYIRENDPEYKENPPEEYAEAVNAYDGFLSSFLLEYSHVDKNLFALYFLYIDEDEIPEMFLYVSYSAYLYTYDFNNKKVVSLADSYYDQYMWWKGVVFIPHENVFVAERFLSRDELKILYKIKNYKGLALFAETTRFNLGEYKDKYFMGSDMEVGIPEVEKLRFMDPDDKDCRKYSVSGNEYANAYIAFIKNIQNVPYWSDKPIGLMPRCPYEFGVKDK